MMDTQLNIYAGDPSVPTLLELAANNDADGLKLCLERDPTSAGEPSPWYGRCHSSPRMAVNLRTPLMVAATFASLDVLKLLLSSTPVDINRSCGQDRTTALHCAAAGGSPVAPSVVKLLLSLGADPQAVDAAGRTPSDVVTGRPDTKNAILELLGAPERYPQTPAPEKRDYPVDPSFPDIKNSLYSTDEFRMFSFKVKPCSRAYSHDWTECPFVHPGENARRRDPRKYHYSCVPCPEFRKGACRRGDLCEYAHGVFECWLHPAQYRTRLCKDGTACNRRVCFFAHTQEELRPLYLNLGTSTVSSPRSGVGASSAMVMDMAAALGMMPGSPLSPSGNGMSAWNQQGNVPSLHLSGSRLRAALNARDMAMDPEISMLQEMEHQQLLSDISGFSANHGRLNMNLKSLAPANLDDLFSSEMSLSPRYEQQAGAAAAIYSPFVLNQFQQHQSMLSPINTNPSFLQATLGIGSPGRMSPRGIEPVSPMSTRLAAMSQHDKLRSLSSKELGSGCSALPAANNPWSKWGSASGKAEWAVDGEELGRLRRSNSLEHMSNGDEPDVSWVQSLVKESPTDMKEKKGRGSSGTDHDENGGGVDQTALGAWIEQMQL